MQKSIAKLVLTIEHLKSIDIPSETKNKIETQNTEITQMQQEYNQLKQKFDSEKLEFEKMKLDYEKQIRQLTDDNADMKHEMDRLSFAKEQELTKLQQENDSKMSELTQRVGELSTIKTKYDELQTKNEENEQKLAKLNGEFITFETVKNNFVNTIERLEQSKYQLNEEKQGLEDKNRRLNKDMESLNEEITKLKEKISQLENKVKEQQQQQQQRQQTQNHLGKRKQDNTEGGGGLIGLIHAQSAQTDRMLTPIDMENRLENTMLTQLGNNTTFSGEASNTTSNVTSTSTSNHSSGGDPGGIQISTSGSNDQNVTASVSYSTVTPIQTATPIHPQSRHMSPQHTRRQDRHDRRHHSHDRTSRSSTPRSHRSRSRSQSRTNRHLSNGTRGGKSGGGSNSLTDGSELMGSSLGDDFIARNSRHQKDMEPYHPSGDSGVSASPNEAKKQHSRQSSHRRGSRSSRRRSNLNMALMGGPMQRNYGSSSLTNYVEQLENKSKNDDSFGNPVRNNLLHRLQTLQ